MQHSFKVPAVCDSCRSIFPSGIVLAGDIRDLTLSRNKAGPCPICGSMGSVLDGTFNFINGVFDIISASDATIEELKKLKTLLQSARTSADYEVVRQGIEKSTPRFNKLHNFLPQNRQEGYTFVMMLLAVVTVVLMLRQQPVQYHSSTAIEVNYVAEQALNICLEKHPNSP